MSEIAPMGDEKIAEVRMAMSYGLDPQLSLEYQRELVARLDQAEAEANEAIEQVNILTKKGVKLAAERESYRQRLLVQEERAENGWAAYENVKAERDALQALLKRSAETIGVLVDDLPRDMDHSLAPATQAGITLGLIDRASNQAEDIKQLRNEEAGDHHFD